MGKNLLLMRITPKWIIRSGQNSNSFELLCLSSLPAILTKIQSKVTEKSWRHHFLHCSRALNSKITGQIRPKFEPVRDFMPVLVSCKFDEDWIHSNWEKTDTIFPIQSHWERSRANNSVVKSPTRPGPNLISCEILCLSLLLASLTKIWLKVTEKTRAHRFAHYMSFCCHGNQFWSDLPQNLMQPFPHPKDATDKIWLKLANWSWRYKCSKVWMTTDDRALLYYKLTLWAFGSGQLKTVFTWDCHNWPSPSHTPPLFTTLPSPVFQWCSNDLSPAFLTCPYLPRSWHFL